MSVAPDSNIPPRLANVPAFPPVVMKLLSILADENGSVANIAACVATDPIFSARILKRANAADIASYLPAQDVLRALLTLGIERTRELTLTIATISYLGSSLKTEQLCRCWRHTVACAMSSAAISRACGYEPGEAYTAGLLHDIGRLGLIAAYRSGYEQTIAQALQEDGDLLALERERFGVDHAEAGCWLAERWKLPESVAKVALHHHDEPVGPLDILRITQVSCRLADAFGYSVGPHPANTDFEQVAALLPPFVRPRLRAAMPQLQKEIADQISLFGYADPRMPVRPIQVKIDEVEEEEFLADFSIPEPAPAPHASRYSRRWIIAAIVLLTVLVLALLRR